MVPHVERDDALAQLHRSVLAPACRAHAGCSLVCIDHEVVLFAGCSSQHSTSVLDACEQVLLAFRAITFAQLRALEIAIRCTFQCFEGFGEYPTAFPQLLMGLTNLVHKRVVSLSRVGNLSMVMLIRPTFAVRFAYLRALAR